MYDSLRSRFLYVAIVATLAIGIAVGFLRGQSIAQAQDMEPQTYSVIGGTAAEFNTAILSFAPQNLQVHRGDTVQWVQVGFHNIHFEEGPIPLIIEGEVNGETRMQFNPGIAFPTIENGAVYQGGDVNSGVLFLSETPTTTFSLVMDVEPGTYNYFCDVHPGMAGIITVVDDATAIPSPAEALVAGTEDLAMKGSAATEAAFGAAMEPRTVDAEGVLAVDAGLQTGFAASLAYYPSVATIEAGQTVTWTIPANSMEPHTITWPPTPPGAEFEMIPQEGGPPVLALTGPAFPSVESGSSVGADGMFNSGLLLPGQSYTLTFTEPGVYNYLCILHPGMNAAVVVMPQME